MTAPSHWGEWALVIVVAVLWGFVAAPLAGRIRAFVQTRNGRRG